MGRSIRTQACDVAWTIRTTTGCGSREKYMTHDSWRYRIADSHCSDSSISWRTWGHRRDCSLGLKLQVTFPRARTLLPSYGGGADERIASCRPALARSFVGPSTLSHHPALKQSSYTDNQFFEYPTPLRHEPSSVVLLTSVVRVAIFSRLPPTYDLYHLETAERASSDLSVPIEVPTWMDAQYRKTNSLPAQFAGSTLSILCPHQTPSFTQDQFRTLEQRIPRFTHAPIKQETATANCHHV